MKLIVARIIFFLLILFAGFNTSAQNITGIWRGYFVTENLEQYKFEIQIEQSSTNRVGGVSYSYLDTRFYGKATLTGYFNKATKTALVQEIKTVEVRMSAGSVACIMKCNLTYVRSGKEEFLEGTYTSAYEADNERSGDKRGDDCGGGKVYLRKVTTSDFYVEPFLRDKPITRSTPKNNTPAKPPVQKQNNTTTKPPVKKPATTPPAKKDEVVEKQNNEVEKTTIVEEQPKKVVTPKLVIPKQTRARENELIKTLNVENEEIIIKLYDNGEIDDDTISVYLDDKIILSNKRLSASPITFTVKLDDANSEHVLVMVAENLGRIPPNTSLMIVYDGDKRYEVRITATEQKNAMIRLRYHKNLP